MYDSPLDTHFSLPEKWKSKVFWFALPMFIINTVAEQAQHDAEDMPKVKKAINKCIALRKEVEECSKQKGEDCNKVYGSDDHIQIARDFLKVTSGRVPGIAESFFEFIENTYDGSTFKELVSSKKMWERFPFLFKGGLREQRIIYLNDLTEGCFKDVIPGLRKNQYKKPVLAYNFKLQEPVFYHPDPKPLGDPRLAGQEKSDKLAMLISSNRLDLSRRSKVAVTNTDSIATRTRQRKRMKVDTGDNAVKSGEATGQRKNGDPNDNAEDMEDVKKVQL